MVFIESLFPADPMKNTFDKKYDMFRLCFLLSSVTFISCTTESNIWYNQTITLKPGEGIEIECKKSPGTINMKNRSDIPIILSSKLKTLTIIKPHDIFQYRIPKKGKIRFINSNTTSALISYSIESNNPFVKTIIK
ncbi:hypothetical protein IW15_03765 [Chryseobacterium soli]|uniref:Uncharacterized protein n=1 Tax=Chryseobacterium soli TaxID=445961 RepID=A0A086ACZ6_9FLAO|nr:hypothetical protein [Chryseobacterium soli]KFF14560.1 hypothetical protein IW15_03765 [Chryseobacterium soli]